MNNLPRFLPLVFVAVGGVLAMKAISSLDGAPEFLRQATAFAAGPAAKPDTAKPKPVTAKKPAAKAAGGEGGADPSNDTTATMDSLFAEVESASASAPSAADASKPAAATTPAPVCPTSAADLAKQAGISPSELTIIQSLGVRRQQLDAREVALNSQSQLLDAASAKLDARIKQLQDIKAQIQGLLDQANKTSDADALRMVKVYESMKPKDAAAVMATMDDSVRLPIAAKMKEAKLAAVLGAMPAADAKDLTEKLSQRMKRTNDVNAKLNQVAGTAGAAKPAAAPAAAKPATPKP